MRRARLLVSFLIVFSMLLAAYIIPSTEIPIDIPKGALNSTCVIHIDGNKGATGVLLDTGYVLTAAHAIDRDRNGVLSEKERRVNIEMFGSVVPARAIALGESDWCLLELPVNVSFMGTTASKRKSKFGERIFTIGATAGYNKHLTDGRVSLPDHGFARASCPISGGNSGGAIFAEDGSHLGVVVAVGMRNEFDQFQVPIPMVRSGKRRLMIVTARMMRRVQISDICLFLPIETVREELAAKNLDFLLDVPPQPALLDSYYLYAPYAYRLFFRVLIFLMVVSYVRKHLFG